MKVAHHTTCSSHELAPQCLREGMLADLAAREAVRVWVRRVVISS